MSNFSSSSNNISSSSSMYSNISIPISVCFWLYLLADIPSIVCSLFVLYYLLFDRKLRQALKNHVIIVLLVIGLVYELTDIPWILYYYQYGIAWHTTPIFCLLWSFIDYGVNVTQTMLFAWASIERHILIFHDRWVSTRKKRFFVHYLPLIATLLYCLVFYSVIIFFPPCPNLFDYSISGCISLACAYTSAAVRWWDRVGHQILPTFIIGFCNIGLLIRILWQKHRLIQRMKWRKYRKMAIQLLSVSALYFFLYIPYMLVNFIRLFPVSRRFGSEFSAYAVFFSYYVIFLFPFVCAGALPELRIKVKTMLRCYRRQTQLVGPLPLIAVPRQIHLQKTTVAPDVQK